MKQRCAFTLAEILVVIAILAVLAALLFPVLAKAKTRANLVQDISQMRQVYVAIDLYNGDSDDRLPASLLFVEPYAKSKQVFVSPVDPFRDGIPGIADFPANMADDDGTHLRSPFRISYAYLVPMARNHGYSDDWIGARRNEPGYGLLALSMYNEKIEIWRPSCQIDFCRKQLTEHRILMDGSYHEVHLHAGWSWTCSLDGCFGNTDNSPGDTRELEGCPGF